MATTNDNKKRKLADDGDGPPIKQRKLQENSPSPSPSPSPEPDWRSVYLAEKIVEKEKQKYIKALEQYSTIETQSIIDLIIEYAMKYPSLEFYQHSKRLVNRQLAFTQRYSETFSKKMMHRIRFMIGKENKTEFVKFLEEKQHFISIQDVCTVVEDHKHVRDCEEIGYKILALLVFVHDAYLEDRKYLNKVIDFLMLNGNVCKATICYDISLSVREKWGKDAGHEYGYNDYFGEHPFKEHPWNKETDIPNCRCELAPCLAYTQRYFR